MKIKNLFLLWLALFATELQGTFAQGYKVYSVSSERLEVTNRLDDVADADAFRIVEPYKKSVDSVMTPILGQSLVAMNVKRPESLLSNWAADVMVETSTATGLPKADMGLINMGGLRNNMPEGIVRRGDIIQISPFENKVCVLEMKGSDVEELMRNIASAHGEGVSSEVRLVISSDGQLRSATINGQPIDHDRTYRIATIDYLAEGNDKMVALKKHGKKYDMGMLARDAMMESIIKNRNISSRIEGRIVVE